MTPQTVTIIIANNLKAHTPAGSLLIYRMLTALNKQVSLVYTWLEIDNALAGSAQEYEFSYFFYHFSVEIGGRIGNGRGVDSAGIKTWRCPMAANKRFGELLSEGIVSVSRRHSKTIVAVEWEIAQVFGFASHHIVERWRRGYIPKVPEQIAYLVRYCVTHGRVDRSWASSLLTQVHYHGSEILLQDLFSASAQRAPRPPVYQNLPPRYGDFLGRAEEMKRLLHGLTSRWPIIAIEGMGGVGKTTLAIEAAHRCLPGPNLAIEQPFDAITWVSAKARPEQKLWLNEVLDTVARLLDYLYITQQPLAQKKAEVDKLLRTYRMLIMIDNFETIDDPDLETWMQDVPEPSKVLITSRHTQMRSVWPIHLRGLEEPQALALIRRHAQRLHLPALETTDDAALLPLVDVTEGNPKAIEMALGHVKYSGLRLDAVVDHLHTAHQTVNDIFSYLFAHTWDVLTEDAKHLLLVTPFFRETMSKEAIGAAAGLVGYRLDMAIRQLVEMSMLDVGDGSGKTGQRYSTHPLIRAFATGQLCERSAWESEARERWVAWYDDFLTLHDSNDEDWTAFAILDEEHENIISMIEWSLTDNPTVSLSILQRFWNFLYIRGYWQQCERYARQALERANIEGNVPARLWLASHLGWLLSERVGPAKDAIQQLHSVENEILSLGQPMLLGETYVLNYLGQAYLSLGDLEMAELYHTRCLDLARRNGNRRHALVARYYLALIQFRRGYLQEAQQGFSELLPEARDLAWERAEGYCAYHLARALSDLGQFEEAERCIGLATTIADRWNEPYLQGYVLFGRAHLLWKQKQHIDAHALALKALDIYQRLGARDLHDPAELVAQLEQELAL